MFTLLDITTIGSILILLAFLVILIVIEKSLSKPRIYLRTVLLIALTVLLVDELIYLKQYGLVLWFFPILIAAFFLIYPLVYLYSWNLVFSYGEISDEQTKQLAHDKNIKKPNLLLILILPIIILIIVAALYYPLDDKSKIIVMTFHYIKPGSYFKGLKLYQYSVIPAYYLQTTFYMVATLKLIFIVKKNINSRPWELLIVRYILFYVVGVIVYEFLVIINTIVMINNPIVLKTIEMLLTLLFISAGMYIGFKQSLILLQSKISQYSSRLETTTEPNQIKKVLLESEKQEIKRAIENYFNDSKIYLDPNLKLEGLSKKIHIPVKKVSNVINELYGKNFVGFINDFRIFAAKTILSENSDDIKIDDVYTRVGFNSRSTFNRVFKTVVGTTPVEFLMSRKINGQNNGNN